MFTTPAYAQTALGGGDFLSGSGGLLIPLILSFIILYFMIIRPQQQRTKQQAEVLKAIRRGDIIVLSNGMIAKVTKSVEGEADIEAEIAEGVRVKIVREMISSVRSKTEPVKSAAKA